MGKTLRWFRALLGAKKSSNSSPLSSESDSRPTKEKKKWCLIKSSIGNEFTVSGIGLPSIHASASSSYVEALDANKHAIVVAAATAAVAESALATAQAAAELVRLTSGSSRHGEAYVSSGCDRRRESAGVKIQSAFRAYLARRALRALKGLVKLQALVRGHIVRKQSVDMLRRMQAMVRIQARTCANRAYMSESAHSSNNSSQYHHPDFATPKKYDQQLRAYSTKLDGSILKNCGPESNIKDSIGLARMQLGSNWLERWMEENSWKKHKTVSLKNGCADDEKSDKILEIDTWKPSLSPKQNDKTFQTSQYFSAWNDNGSGVTTFDSLSRHSTKSQKPNPSLFSVSLRSTENSPQVYSASSRPGSSGRRGPFSSTRSERPRSFFGDYPGGHPNYMANTESYLAKVRSPSAPRHKLQFENPYLTNSDTCSEKAAPTLRANFRNKAYRDRIRSFG